MCMCVCVRVSKCSEIWICLRFAGFDLRELTDKLLRAIESNLNIPAKRREEENVSLIMKNGVHLEH